MVPRPPEYQAADNRGPIRPRRDHHPRLSSHTGCKRWLAHPTVRPVRIPRRPGRRKKATVRPGRDAIHPSPSGRSHCIGSLVWLTRVQQGAFSDQATLVRGGGEEPAETLVENPYWENSRVISRVASTIAAREIPRRAT